MTATHRTVPHLGERLLVPHLSESVLASNATMRDVMTPAPHTIASNANVAEAHRRMRQLHCRHLPVTRDGALVGVVSDRDLYMLGTLFGTNSGIDRVVDAMTAEVYTTTPEARVNEVAPVMAAEKYGAAIVVEEGRIVGIFTSIDALRYLVGATS